jgi:hypothetical protein
MGRNRAQLGQGAYGGTSPLKISIPDGPETVRILSKSKSLLPSQSPSSPDEGRFALEKQLEIDHDGIHLHLYSRAVQESFQIGEELFRYDWVDFQEEKTIILSAFRSSHGRIILKIFPMISKKF